MHIPDGYLSPQTALPALGIMLPMWSVAVHKVKKVFKSRHLPLLSLCAAFSFVIMMFNIPFGATSVHAVGAVFVAIMLGPWAACISVSAALTIQALVFGDGGILALGANCLNMAVVMPFAGYYTYKLIAGNSGLSSKRSMVGIFLGSYVGLNMAALFTAIEFGIQPMLFKTIAGVPKYGYFPLWVSIPAIMIGHLLAAGPMEGIVTVFAIRYIHRVSPELLSRNASTVQEGEDNAPFFKRYKGFIAALILLIVLSPLGLLATGTAWGEWSRDEVKNMLGYLPEGMGKLSGLWKSVLPDYRVPGLGNGFVSSSIGYVLAAVVGILAISLVMILSGRFITKKGDK